MNLKGILNLVWGKYGLIGVVVILACLVVLDQMYQIGLGEMIKAFFGGL